MATTVQAPEHRAVQQPNDLKPLLRGALAFPITPYAADGSLDLDGVRANARWLAGSGICAVVAPSGTGELFGLSPDECAAVIEATVEAVDGRKPVIAGVGYGPTVAAGLARRAEAAGASGILVMPPYYGKPDPFGLLAYYQAVGDATSLGIMPYARDAAAFTPALVEQMARDVPNFIAFKDGRGDVRLFQQIRERVVAALGPDRLVWLAGVGDDLVGPYFAVGAEGFTSSLACFWPEASTALFRLASTGDTAGLAAYHARVVRPIYEMRQRRGGYEVAVMKAAMDLLGHPAGPARPPLATLTAAETEELRGILQTLDVPTARDRLAAS
ncbi:MAG: dihydrodipicolinate synthase family protein [Thermomicrobiales bacterium]